MKIGLSEYSISTAAARYIYIAIGRYVLSHLGTSRVVEMSWLLNKNVLGILNKHILSTVVLEESVTTHTHLIYYKIR